jgi:hypothetical protein
VVSAYVSARKRLSPDTQLFLLASLNVHNPRTRGNRLDLGGALLDDLNLH